MNFLKSSIMISRTSPIQIQMKRQVRLGLKKKVTPKDKLALKLRSPSTIQAGEIAKNNQSRPMETNQAKKNRTKRKTTAQPKTLCQRATHRIGPQNTRGFLMTSKNKILDEIVSFIYIHLI